jgi:Flp pilus assembly protein TadG
VAILSVVLATALIVMAGFAVDFGMAYNSKQRLQIAADAGALAAAQVYSGDPRPCTALAADGTLAAEAQAAADSIAAPNRPGMASTPITITCPDGELTVTYSTSGSTPTIFGPLAGSEDQITTSRTAAATLSMVGSMRPWGICSNVANTSGQVVFVPTKGAATTSEDADDLCGPDGPPGGWWVAQCTGQSNADGATETTVETGCPTSDYHPVAGQPTSGPTDLLQFLRSACPSGAENSTCLASDNGNNFHNASEEWQPLVGKTFTMPVFCVEPTCSDLAVAGNGANASYAIHRMAKVELCGFEFQPRPASANWPTTGPCATSNPKNYESSDVTEGGGFFLVVKGLYGGPLPPWELDEPVPVRLTQ